MTAREVAIIRALPIASIAAPSFVRTQNGHDKESLSQLAESIKTHGLIQPIVVRECAEDEVPADGPDPYHFVIVAGRRRLAACKMAGMLDIPAIVSETDEAKSYELEIAENIQREQMTLADTARAVRTLMMIHDSAKKVGQILNKSPAWVSKHLTISASSFSPSVADLLERGLVDDLETLLLLNQVHKLHKAGQDDGAFVRLLNIAHRGDMSRTLARDALAKLRSPKPAPSPVAVKTTTASVAGSAQQQELPEAEPRSTFAIELPIRLLEKLESLGGTEWLVAQLDAASGA